MGVGVYNKDCILETYYHNQPDTQYLVVRSALWFGSLFRIVFGSEAVHQLVHQIQDAHTELQHKSRQFLQNNLACRKTGLSTQS